MRTAIQSGSGGNLLSSGYIPVKATYLGRLGFGYPPSYRFSGEIAPVELPAGDYWATIAMVSKPGGTAYFLGTTSGANGVGEPLHNGNSFYDSVTLGYDFIDVQEVLGPDPWDFSIGLEGRPVPEPAMIVMVSAWIASMLRSRTRRA